MIAYIYTTYNTYMIAVAMLAQVVSQAQLGPQPNFFVHFGCTSRWQFGD